MGGGFKVVANRLDWRGDFEIGRGKGGTTVLVMSLLPGE